MSTHRDSELTDAFAACCEHARADLKRHMASRGLRFEDGWRIHERMHNAEGKTVIVMTPIHVRLQAPPELRCVCSIDEDGLVDALHCDA